MLRMRNKYCSNCLSTQRFLDLGTTLVCERCSKRLELVAVPADRAEGTLPEGRMVVRPAAWAARPDAQREAV